jgi:hypothetical protein
VNRNGNGALVTFDEATALILVSFGANGLGAVIWRLGRMRCSCPIWEFWVPVRSAMLSISTTSALPRWSNRGSKRGNGFGGATLVLSTRDSKGIYDVGEGIFAFCKRGSLDASSNYASCVGGHSDGTLGFGNIGCLTVS